MPNALYPPLKPRTFAELLDAVLQISRLSLLKCLPYATLAIIAGQVSTLYYMWRGRWPLPALDGNDPVGVALYGVGTLIFVIAVLVSAAITAFVLPALALAPAYRTAGLAVMLAPAIYIGIALSFSVPALVLAQKGVLASLAYSFRL